MSAEVKKLQAHSCLQTCFSVSRGARRTTLIQEALNETFCGEKLPVWTQSLESWNEMGLLVGSRVSSQVLTLVLPGKQPFSLIYSKDILFKLAATPLLKQGDNGSMEI